VLLLDLSSSPPDVAQQCRQGIVSHAHSNVGASDVQGVDCTHNVNQGLACQSVGTAQGTQLSSMASEETANKSACGTCTVGQGLGCRVSSNHLVGNGSWGYKNVAAKQVAGAAVMQGQTEALSLNSGCWELQG
jgi:hypothetical protein